jgi:hypothetical protein
VTLRGRLERRDLEGGTWVLVLDRIAGVDREWVLIGSVPPGLAGTQVEIEGDKDGGSDGGNGGFGLFMQGPQFKVRSVRPA